MGKILAFSGSNSSKSINQQFVKIVSELVENNEVEIIDIRDYSTIIFSKDEEKNNGIPDVICSLYEKFNSANAFLISVPEYNRSLPSDFKNIIDWITRIEKRIFAEKPCLFLSATTGKRGGREVLFHITKMMPSLGAHIIGTYGLSEFYNSVDNNVLKDEYSSIILKDLVSKLEFSISFTEE